MAKRTPTPKPHNCGEWTHSRWKQQIRSFLRRAFRFYKPITNCLNSARRKYSGPKSNQKWEYQCKECGEWHTRKNVQVDHIVPCGSFSDDLSDLGEWVFRLSAESQSDYQVLCKSCHSSKTHNK